MENPSSITEDQLAQALIRNHRNSSEENPSIRPEEHYNYYGDRGVVDLYVEGDVTGYHLYELKSTAALQSVTGANEIIRQFNRMVDYFFKDTAHEIPPPNSRSRKGNVTYELCFTPAPECLQHVIDNFDLYISLLEKSSGVPYTPSHERILITMRWPDTSIEPLILISGNVNMRASNEDYGWSNHALPHLDRLETEYDLSGLRDIITSFSRREPQ